VSLLDFLNGRVGFALRAAGDVDGAIVLVEDLAQLFTNTWDFVSTVSWYQSKRLADLPA